ncbi:hypothetical protein GGR56DRAFT_506995 [Xylariaceae sp. FL0804]|nr:hypothetical protein GGR56DRAFT_506995 [Xylariaceae sp. FL0804]
MLETPSAPLSKSCLPGLSFPWRWTPQKAADVRITSCEQSTPTSCAVFLPSRLSGRRCSTRLGTRIGTAGAAAACRFQEPAFAECELEISCSTYFTGARGPVDVDAPGHRSLPDWGCMRAVMPPPPSHRNRTSVRDITQWTRMPKSRFFPQLSTNLLVEKDDLLGIGSAHAVVGKVARSPMDKYSGVYRVLYFEVRGNCPLCVPLRVSEKGSSSSCMTVITAVVRNQAADIVH